MTPEPIYRYRAVKPFEEAQSMLFFGRKAETEQLAALIFSEKLTVLYGKSGYGKSSLLNAGILPRLKSENENSARQYVPIPVRFQAAEAAGAGLMDKFRFHFGQAMTRQKVLDRKTPATLPDTLWGLFKTVDAPQNAVFILLFDQFEEFFSYPEAQQEAFKTQLSELLYTTYPQFVRENRKNLGDAELDFLSRDLDVRAVFAIRADRLSELDKLSRPLTTILKNRMELGALSPAQARDAILLPAALPNDAGQFRTHPFGFSTDALQAIETALVGKESKRIESFVLQIVCFSIEKNVERTGLAEIDAPQLPAFDEVFDTYYREQLDELGAPDTPERDHAAHILEYQLLGLNPHTGEAHRRSVDSVDLNAPPALLDALERTYLIRREVNSFGRYSYEISHDTLMEPILKARKVKDAAAEEQRKEQERMEAETRAREAEIRVEEERRRAEEAERLKTAAEEGQKRARQRTRIAAFVALLALVGLGTAIWQSIQATITADQAVHILLPDIDRNIYRLEYDLTYHKCRTALNLKARRGEVAKRIWEIAWFYTEADSAAAAIAFLNLLQPLGFKANAPNVQAKLRTYLAQTIPVRYLDSLQMRYYPQTVSVEGGAFLRDDSVQVRVNSFRMGQHEITYWQYNLFAQAVNHHIEPPSWEYAGDNPAVYVNWFDAAFYLNWLSERHGKQKVYTLTNPKEGGYYTLYDVAADSTANGYRLPTAAEAAFAARGGRKTKGYRYSGNDTLNEVGWYRDNANSRTHPVGRKKANELGLYDLSGNVWEWCREGSGSSRVIHGGAWNGSPEGCRVGYRGGDYPDYRYNAIGFRLVLAP